MQDLFSTPIASKKVNDNVTAYKYPNGCININGQKYFGYSFTAAIKLFKESIKQNKK